jgi:hypothetical protein
MEERFLHILLWEYRGMAEDEEEKGKTDPVDTGPNLNKLKKLMEKEEPSINILQWYLKMILNGEDDPKPKK